MKTADRVLELLYDRGEKFFLKEELAEAADLPPRRLDNALDLLRQRGQEIDLVPGMGLRLRRPARLDAHLIERELGSPRVGRHVICFGEVDSTNDVAFDSARTRGADGLVVLAESQRRGRGRHGRKWISPAGANILMSVLLCDEHEELSHEALTIAAGLAVAQGVEDFCHVDCRLKWPNDVLLDGHKLAGVLVQVRAVQGVRCVVVGLGINVNAAPPAGEVDSPATCLADHVGHALERIEAVRAVLRRLDKQVEGMKGDHPAGKPARFTFCVEQPPSAVQASAGKPGGSAFLDRLHRDWLARCDMINQRITVLCEGRQHVGRVLDISPLGGLVLQDDHGRQVHLPAVSSSILK